MTTTDRPPSVAGANGASSPGSSGKTIELKILRYDPEKDAEPHFQTYAVPYREDWVVLDAINWAKDTLDGSIAHRWSCRMGVCGSCGMNVNGVPTLTCHMALTEVAPGPVTIEPLGNFPIIRDLVVDISSFMDKLKSVSPWLIPAEEKPVEMGEYLQTPDELDRYKPQSMCINCLLCYAACPVIAIDPTFVGPAAIALAYRYNEDSRDHGKNARIDVIGSHNGIWSCTYVGECSVVCPKHVDPAEAIQRSKLGVTMDWYKSMLMPWANR